MQNVKIKSGQHYASEISGTFPLAQKYCNSKYSKREGFVWILKNDKKVKLHVNAKDISVVSKNDGKSEAVICKEIEERFDVMETLIDGVINRSISSMIVTGAPGIGKSFTIDEKLMQAKEDGKIRFSQMTGSCTPIGLYMQLYQHQNPGDVLVLDDIDTIFSDIESLNLLKGALDTGRTRQISWMSASNILRDEGMENTFDFRGTVIFISNMNFDALIEKASKMSPHFAALINRCVYLDLGIHTTQEVMIRIKQVIRTTNILEDLKLDRSYTHEIVMWMEKHQNDLRSLSIRTILQLASFIKTSERSWKAIARTTMLKR